MGTTVHCSNRACKNYKSSPDDLYVLCNKSPYKNHSYEVWCNMCPNEILPGKENKGEVSLSATESI